MRTDSIPHISTSGEFSEIGVRLGWFVLTFLVACGAYAAYTRLASGLREKVAFAVFLSPGFVTVLNLLTGSKSWPLVQAVWGSWLALGVLWHLTEPKTQGYYRVGFRESSELKSWLFGPAAALFATFVMLASWWMISHKLAT